HQKPAGLFWLITYLATGSASIATGIPPFTSLYISLSPSSLRLSFKSYLPSFNACLLLNSHFLSVNTIACPLTPYRLVFTYWPLFQLSGTWLINYFHFYSL